MKALRYNLSLPKINQRVSALRHGADVKSCSSIQVTKN